MTYNSWYNVNSSYTVVFKEYDKEKSLSMHVQYRQNFFIPNIFNPTLVISVDSEPTDTGGQL